MNWEWLDGIPYSVYKFRRPERRRKKKSVNNVLLPSTPEEYKPLTNWSCFLYLLQLPKFSPNFTHFHGERKLSWWSCLLVAFSSSSHTSARRRASLYLSWRVIFLSVSLNLLMTGCVVQQLNRGWGSQFLANPPQLPILKCKVVYSVLLLSSLMGLREGKLGEQQYLTINNIQKGKP